MYRNKRGARRVSPALHRFLLATHVIVSVGWLGVSVAKLVLGLVATTTYEPDSLYASMRVVDVVFPPAAVGAAVTGILLSLGTKWGVLRHYWVVAKLGLTVGVIATGVLLMERLIQESIAVTPGQAAETGTIPGVEPAQVSLVSLSVAHVLMLGAATVVSVYKPWGKIRFGRRGSTRGEG